LWRLQNGELPSNLESDLYWILIGTNDFGDGCSDEIVYVGILRIIEEMQRLRPDSVLVVNSLLPRSDVMNVGDGTISGNSTVSKIWEGIKIVNSKLRDYCNTLNNSQKLHYFDATDIFLRVDGSNNHERIPKELMNDFLHPSAAGYQLWAERITQAYNSIFVNRYRKKQNVPLKN
jgi:lysophospholipase L1-like esterase